MSERIKIWLVGNTGLRNPNRIQEGFSVFANSSFVGHLHGRENELAFMNLLDEKGIIQNEEGKDSSGSHARKWRLMFARNGLIYPQIQKKGRSARGSRRIGRYYALWQIIFKSRYIPSGAGVLSPSDERRTVYNARWYALFFSVKVVAGNHAGA